MLKFANQSIKILKTSSRCVHILQTGLRLIRLVYEYASLYNSTFRENIPANLNDNKYYLSCQKYAINNRSSSFMLLCNGIISDYCSNQRKHETYNRQFSTSRH